MAEFEFTEPDLPAGSLSYAQFVAYAENREGLSLTVFAARNAAREGPQCEGGRGTGGAPVCSTTEVRAPATSVPQISPDARLPQLS